VHVEPPPWWRSGGSTCSKHHIIRVVQEPAGSLAEMYNVFYNFVEFFLFDLRDAMPLGQNRAQTCAATLSQNKIAPCKIKAVVKIKYGPARIRIEPRPQSSPRAALAT
jgi:hypothetical protein